MKKSERNRIRNRALLAIAITLATGLISSGFPLPYYTRTGTGDIFSLSRAVNFPFLIIDIILWFIIICILTVALQIATARLRARIDCPRIDVCARNLLIKCEGIASMSWESACQRIMRKFL